MDVRQRFIFDGHNSADYGLVISGENTHNAPERDTDILEIPGRSGTLTVDNGRWNNVDLPYKVFLYGERLNQQMDAVREWLLTAKGYKRLEDSYHPDSYRMARYSGGVEWDVDIPARCAEATLTFNCWPQRYLKSGEQPVTVASGGKLYNPTSCAALPLLELTLTGDAKLQIGGIQVGLAGYTGPMIVDCELQDAYKDGANLNRYITAPDFPTLEPGITQISWTGGIGSLKITPRWWTL